MATLIEHATHVAAAGNRPKIIEEFVGRANSGTTAVCLPAFSPDTVHRDP